MEKNVKSTGEYTARKKLIENKRKKENKANIKRGKKFRMAECQVTKKDTRHKGEKKKKTNSEIIKKKRKYKYK